MSSARTPSPAPSCCRPPGSPRFSAIGPDRHRYLERKARLPRHRLWTGESGVPGGAETEPVRFRAVAVEAWHARRISTGRLADLLEMPSADVRLLLHRQALDPERSYRVPSAEPDRL
jgi:predicted HTH domain antitoxin